MKTISIVGAGWLGMPLGAALAADGYRVIGTTTRQEKLAQLNEMGIEGVLLNLDNATGEAIARATQCDILIVTVPPRGGNDHYGEVLNRLLISARRNSVAHLIYTSATSVYPAHNQEVREEDAKLVTSSHSGVQLLAMENIFRQAGHPEATIVRFGGLFGPGRQPGRWLAGRKDVAGADSPVNMIHLTDCIGVMRAIIEKEAWGQTYNAVSPVHPTRREFYQAACEAIEMEPPHWNDQPRPWKKVNSEKISHELNYSFTFADPRRAFSQLLP